MKKNCWEILGIPRTKDTAIIRKAYRELIKKYHPDTVQAPEKIRKHIIKCVEIIQAYKEAMEFAETHQHEPETTTLRTEHKVRASSQKKQGVFVRVFATFIFLLFVIPAIFFVIELLNIYPALTHSMNFVFTFYESMPLESTLKMRVFSQSSG